MSKSTKRNTTILDSGTDAPFYHEYSAIGYRSSENPGSKSRPAPNVDSKYLVWTVGLGTFSGVLYFLLYAYQDELVHFAELTRQGEKIDFLIPIIIAFIFSLVHGTFTGYFWEITGFKAKTK